MRGRAAALVLAALCSAGLSACSLIFGEEDTAAEVLARRRERVAVLPMVVAGAGPCELCPDNVEAVSADPATATLYTAFFHEALDRHPRLDKVDHADIRRLASRGQKAAVADLLTRGAADYVLVSVLTERRERVGDPFAPSEAAAVGVYAALRRIGDGAVLWQASERVVDTAGGFFGRQYQRVVLGERKRWRSADAVADEVLLRLAEDMIADADLGDD